MRPRTGQRLRPMLRHHNALRGSSDSRATQQHLRAAYPKHQNPPRGPGSTSGPARRRRSALDRLSGTGDIASDPHQDGAGPLPAARVAASPQRRQGRETRGGAEGGNGREAGPEAGSGARRGGGARCWGAGPSAGSLSGAVGSGGAHARCALRKPGGGSAGCGALRRGGCGAREGSAGHRARPRAPPPLAAPPAGPGCPLAAGLWPRLPGCSLAARPSASAGRRSPQPAALGAG